MRRWPWSPRSSAPESSPPRSFDAAGDRIPVPGHVGRPPPGLHAPGRAECPRPKGAGATSSRLRQPQTVQDQDDSANEITIATATMTRAPTTKYFISSIVLCSEGERPSSFWKVSDPGLRLKVEYR